MYNTLTSDPNNAVLAKMIQAKALIDARRTERKNLDSACPINGNEQP